MEWAPFISLGVMGIVVVVLAILVFLRECFGIEIIRPRGPRP